MIWHSPHGTTWEAETYEEALEKERDHLAEALRRYADLDTWEHVAKLSSPEHGSAWVKKTGHPTPWVDAQEALGR